MSRRLALFASVLVLPFAVSCTRSDYLSGPVLASPTNLRYQLVPSGNANAPDGVILTWDIPNDSRVVAFVVYSRASTGAPWLRRAETTSNSFRDAGTPDLQYEVTAEDASGYESVPSNPVTVDLNRIAGPTAISTITLNRSIQLSWSASARLANPSLFAYYRVYSTSYDLDTGVCDPNKWVLEGTTVSEDFVATGLANGVARCFAVTLVGVDGRESAFSSPHADTPRYDARNVIVYTKQSQPTSSAFRFFQPSTSTLGVLLNASDPTADFFVDRRSDGSTWLTTVRTGTRVLAYGTAPSPDLTSIDIAPVSGYTAGSIEALTGWLYVFETRESDGLHYGALRVTAITPTYIIIDWAYQTDFGNPMLSRVRGKLANVD